jgi:hypothetical protein
MQPRQIIVALESRLLRDMLKRMIGKTRQLHLAAEVNDIESLPAVAAQTRAEWVIVSLCPDGNLPKTVDALLYRCPSLRVLAVSGEGDQVKAKWVQAHEQVLNISTVEELVSVLSGENAE